MLLLFVCSVFFQIRDIIYMSKYEKPDSEEIECHYRYKIKKKNGYTAVECKNKFYCKNFIKNGRVCSVNCRGKKYPDITDSFEMMSSTDIFYRVKKVLFLLGSIFSVILTLLNILDKI